jgi:hypothetical protein
MTIEQLLTGMNLPTQVVDWLCHQQKYTPHKYHNLADCSVENLTPWYNPIINAF